MEIEFIENISAKVSNWSEIRKWINESIINEGFIMGELCYVFMSDDELLKYNQDFLNHDYYTDVITFDNSEPSTIQGDILVSIDRVEANCKELNISYKDEFLRVCIHGVLHLCGYQDKEVEDISEMRMKEDAYLSKVGFDL